MRFESSVFSVSWLPSQAVLGLPKLPFGMGITHYDDPPPDVIAAPHDLEALRAAGRFRFSNELRAWIEVQDGRMVAYGQAGGGRMGLTRLTLGPTVALQAVPLPDLRSEPEVGDGWVRFSQTAGGRAPIPAPRTVARKPFVQLSSPLVWTTLSLVLHVDGQAEHGLVGASSVPRHWVYDASGRLSLKSGLVDFKDWYHHAFGKHSPWGDEDSPAVVTQVESALERELSLRIMRGGTRPRIRQLEQGTALVEQGQAGDELYLLLDGVLSVEVDGEALAEVGPGAVLGERAVLEGGRRTATCGPSPRAGWRWHRRTPSTPRHWRSCAPATAGRITARGEAAGSKGSPALGERWCPQLHAALAHPRLEPGLGDAGRAAQHRAVLEVEGAAVLRAHDGSSAHAPPMEGRAPVAAPVGQGEDVVAP